MNSNLIDKLAKLWSLSPNQRLCQLIVNLTKNDPFFVTDEELEQKIDKQLNKEKR